MRRPILGEITIRRSPYIDGVYLTEKIDRFIAGGGRPEAAPRRVAAEEGREVADVRRAVGFAGAVDRIAGNAGEEAEGRFLAGHPYLSPEVVMRIDRTHPDRQRFALDQVAHGRRPFDKPLAGTDPPFDTLGYVEVYKRVRRSAGLLRRVADGLAATPTEDWPEVAILQSISGRNADARDSASALQLELSECPIRVEPAPTVVDEWQTRDHLSVMGGVTPKGKVYSLVRPTSLNGRHTIEFLVHLGRLGGYPVMIPCDFRYLNGTAGLLRSGFKSLSMR